MRILTYKRTHVGDPSECGCFGIADCMGQVRNWKFDAVIGVGGIGAEPRQEGIAGCITWVGSDPVRYVHPHGRGQIVRFKYFKLFDEERPLLRDVAPLLAARMYDGGGARLLLNGYSAKEKKQAIQIVTTYREMAPKPCSEIPLAVGSTCHGRMLEFEEGCGCQNGEFLPKGICAHASAGHVVDA